MYKALLFALLVGCLKAEEPVNQKCPEMESTKCECIEAYGKAFLTCTRVTDQEIRQALRKFQGMGLFVLSIANSEFTVLPAELLSNISVSKMKITNSKMFFFTDDILQGLISTSLTRIDIDNVLFSEGFDWSAIEELPNLDTVIISGSDIEEVPAGVISSDISITTLELSDDNIQVIYDQAFSYCKKLKNLILKQNFLDNFSRKMLPYPTTDIEFLDLSYNELSSLPEDAFDGMPKLHSLLLARNRFTVLEKSFIEKIWNKLFYVSFIQNPLECDCRMSWLAKERKPFHFFGECKSPAALEGKQLRELKEDDFAICASD